MSIMTIHRRLVERSILTYQPLRHLPFTPAHCQVRLLWCFARSGRNHADRERRVFSDESSFQLCPGDHRRRVWRRPGQFADPAFAIACHTCPQSRVMVYGATYFDRWIPLVVLRGTLTAQRYVDNILRTVFQPFLLKYLGLIFQLDNARPQTARAAMIYPTAYKTLPWPAIPHISLQFSMSGI
ncbi:transposable element Tc1 transposase [Trichonephila clavipes]|uniref:Transposable element Tc1 transposase n=1 Tax=Trichonephila clavipes TaxID=2585209 RepID=A0A8X6VUS8_TRICX|nr:transposable element Tc1 transposase [Trichonephila clavipes]